MGREIVWGWGGIAGGGICPREKCPGGNVLHSQKQRAGSVSAQFVSEATAVLDDFGGRMGFGPSFLVTSYENTAV